MINSARYPEITIWHRLKEYWKSTYFRNIHYKQSKKPCETTSLKSSYFFELCFSSKTLHLKDFEFSVIECMTWVVFRRGFYGAFLEEYFTVLYDSAYFNSRSSKNLKINLKIEQGNNFQKLPFTSVLKNRIYRKHLHQSLFGKSVFLWFCEILRSNGIPRWLLLEIFL